VGTLSRFNDFFVMFEIVIQAVCWRLPPAGFDTRGGH
jgi:hypothetical protein